MTSELFVYVVLPGQTTFVTASQQGSGPDVMVRRLRRLLLVEPIGVLVGDREHGPTADQAEDDGLNPLA